MAKIIYNQTTAASSKLQDVVCQGESSLESHKKGVECKLHQKGEKGCDGSVYNPSLTVGALGL